MTPRQQLDSFLQKYTPEIQKLTKGVLRKLRAIAPGATELVYDNDNALVIGFGPTERASDAAFSIAIYPRWIQLFFLEGKTLDDPHGLLEGSGKQVRRIILRDSEALDDKGIHDLLRQAMEQAKMTVGGRSRLVIKSISKKQRPRTPSHL